MATEDIKKETLFSTDYWEEIKSGSAYGFNETTDDIDVSQCYIFFDEKVNNKVWPSDDPKDKPTHTFSCKKCEYKFDQVFYGSFPNGYNPRREAEFKMLNHIVSYHNKMQG